MTNFDGNIGRLDWTGCVMCRHHHPVRGGCEMSIQELWEKLEIRGDEMHCGHFRHVERDKYEDEDPGQMSLF